MLRHASEAVSTEAGSAAADASGRLYQIKADKHRSHRAVKHISVIMSYVVILINLMLVNSFCVTWRKNDVWIYPAR